MTSCPQCESLEFVKNGTYEVSYERIQKFKCKSCGHFFIENPTKYQKKPDLDYQLLKLANQGFPRRRIAKILKISKRTVDLRLKKLQYK